MAKPVIMTVDDEPAVLGAIERDLRRRYGKDYQIMRAESGAAALQALQQIRLRGQPVALFLVDQRMPELSGVQTLEQAIQIFPEAKRALLTAYADTEAAIKAINEVRLDYYLMKPWDPPDQNLYPVLDDLLEDWHAGFQPPFEGIRVLGHRWSPLTHQIKDYLARNQVPYRWLDVENDPEAPALIESLGVDAAGLPVVLFPDGTHLARPTNAQVAEKAGRKLKATMPFYDLIIVGGGPAGLGAAVYASSEGLRTLMIEREAPGGQAGTSSRIENYLGFPSGLSGWDLARRAVTQASRFGVEILTPQEACALRVEDPYRIVSLGDGAEISCHALMIATGVSYRKLDIPGVDAFTGAGLYYGAAQSEAISYKGEDVYIVGGANSAGQAAMYFAKYARNVTMLVRGDSLSKGMSQYLVDQIEQTPNIQVLLKSSVVEVLGNGRLEKITIANADTGERVTVPTSALFIFIGAMPRTDWVAGVLERDEMGFILTGPDLVRDGHGPKGWPLRRQPYWLEASVPGVFVAGDVRHRSVKRMATAVGEGSMAVQFIHQYLSSL
ncbi:MAG: FAD-dependent oxidoreductase [Chloroflexota bacterium]|nr:FAD-dependent oxidoreductase [Chloroflexota bacterium]MDQ5864718.1 FAD-dependent oxidoreductase [Chloroflexota bacterium]